MNPLEISKFEAGIGTWIMSTTAVEIATNVGTISSAPGKQFALQSSEKLQQRHYDQISAEYETHYSDPHSHEYRRRFIYEPMFEGVTLSGMNVLDAMCGSGQTTEYLLSRNAEVTGLDISNEVMDSFCKRWANCNALRRSLLASGLPDESFDCIAIVGGLHHIHPNVSRAVEEIHRLLKPGGYFCFMEPHSGSLPDLVRRFWYKHDHFFSENEASINVQALERAFESHFTFKKVRYLGNLAFLLVFNSLIFRIPVKAKPFYSPLLMWLEPLVNKLQGKVASCFVVGQWQKR
jgi:SAM-dependent methyltransferase